jgi:aryl-alcohol dehydrogenase-like predicted oxidoreductase
MFTAALTDNRFNAGDARLNHPRFQGENFERNLRLVELVKTLAAAKGCTAAQLALAWVIAQNEVQEDLHVEQTGAPPAKGFCIAPIPGTKRRTYLEQNLAALDVRLSRSDLSMIEGYFAPGAAAGLRYPENRLKELGR